MLKNYTKNKQDMKDRSQTVDYLLLTINVIYLLDRVVFDCFAFVIFGIKTYRSTRWL